MVVCPACWNSLDHKGQRHQCDSAPLPPPAGNRPGPGWTILTVLLFGLAAVYLVTGLVELARLAALGSLAWDGVRDVLTTGWSVVVPGPVVVLVAWLASSRHQIRPHGGSWSNTWHWLLYVSVAAGVVSLLAYTAGLNNLDSRIVVAAELLRLVSAVALILGLVVLRRRVLGFVTGTRAAAG